MTQIDIAALVADREAGTKGPWVALDSEVVMADDVIATVAVIDFDNTEEVQALADVRRIARVPDMEAAIIAQDAELKRLRLSVSAQEDRIDALILILAEALPWVEAQLDDPAYKPGTVSTIANRIRAALGEKP